MQQIKNQPFSKSEFAAQSMVLVMVAGIFAVMGLKLFPVMKGFIPTKRGMPAPEVEAVAPVVAQVVETVTQAAVKIAPTDISIPSLELTLSVAEGVTANNEWTLYDDKISWLATSAQPREGNVILYGHNRKGLFGDLDLLRRGDTITLAHNDKTFTYRVVERRKVLPTDVDAIVANEDRLTLYTCNGVFDEKRLIVIAKPLNE